MTCLSFFESDFGGAVKSEALAQAEAIMMSTREVSFIFAERYGADALIGGGGKSRLSMPLADEGRAWSEEPQTS